MEKLIEKWKYRARALANEADELEKKASDLRREAMTMKACADDLEDLVRSAGSKS